MNNGVGPPLGVSLASLSFFRFEKNQCPSLVTDRLWGLCRQSFRAKPAPPRPFSHAGGKYVMELMRRWSRNWYIKGENLRVRSPLSLYHPRSLSPPPPSPCISWSPPPPHPTPHSLVNLVHSLFLIDVGSMDTPNVDMILGPIVLAVVANVSSDSLRHCFTLGVSVS
jgi:hypothetical protein